ncbi:MAG: hypothetical protein ACRDWT_12145 [Jatrophihabitantaceae bacterium]
MTVSARITVLVDVDPQWSTVEICDTRRKCERRHVEREQTPGSTAADGH